MAETTPTTMTPLTTFVVRHRRWVVGFWLIMLERGGRKGLPAPHGGLLPARAARLRPLPLPPGHARYRVTRRDPGGHRQEQIQLEDGGAVTSHKVKYSHHVDGNAHFSQDGRIRTTVRGRARGLRTAAGHIFSIDVQGLTQFAEFDTDEYYGDRHGRGYFELQGPEPEAVHIVGRWALLPEVVRIEDAQNAIRAGRLRS